MATKQSHKRYKIQSWKDIKGRSSQMRKLVMDDSHLLPAVNCVQCSGGEWEGLDAVV